MCLIFGGRSVIYEIQILVYTRMRYGNLRTNKGSVPPTILITYNLATNFCSEISGSGNGKNPVFLQFLTHSIAISLPIRTFFNVGATFKPFVRSNLVLPIGSLPSLKSAASKYGMRRIAGLRLIRSDFDTIVVVLKLLDAFHWRSASQVRIGTRGTFSSSAIGSKISFQGMGFGFAR